MKLLKYFFLAVVYLLLIDSSVSAQSLNNRVYDSSYIINYSDKTTGRIFASRKYAGIKFTGDNNNDFTYKANTPLTLGAGVTISNLSLNLSFGFGFLNNKNDDRGKTKSIDLQIHFYPNKWAIDILGIRHKGLYIDPEGYATANSKGYYYRPEASFLLAGAGVYRVPNSSRFSYNAAMIQSEAQIKSAGSLLYGGEIFYGLLKDDSALVPAVAANDFAEAVMRELSFITAGLGGGYAYSLVIAKHLYLMGSAIGNLNVNFAKEKYNNTSSKKTSVNPSISYKASIGYNSTAWSLSANWTGNTFWKNGATASKPYYMPVGNYRLIFAMRF